MNPRQLALIEWLRPLARHLPEIIKRAIRRGLTSNRIATPSSSTSATGSGYAERIAAETAIFADQVEVHDLPPIFHYWSNTWLRPALEAHGFSNPDQFFALYLQRTIEDVMSSSPRSVQIASLGCGNCDTEVRVAGLLRERGITDFVIDCIDINPVMLARGRALATDAGVSANIQTTIGDFNNWQPQHGFDAVLANQSLHHVVNLEGLLAAIERALPPSGRFITSDMIGRNGHMRWPEAMEIVHEFWHQLSEPYRWNTQLHRHEKLHEYWDCSNEGFEGIRAQDILPCLIGLFEFEFFFAYANVIDPFIDRAFGPNFDADAQWDRAFIDRVHARDEAEILSGRIKPTHMMAVLRTRPWSGQRVHRPGLTPEFCLRPG